MALSITCQSASQLPGNISIYLMESPIVTWAADLNFMGYVVSAFLSQADRATTARQRSDAARLNIGEARHRLRWSSIAGIGHGMAMRVTAPARKLCWIDHHCMKLSSYQMVAVLLVVAELPLFLSLSLACMQSHCDH